VVDVKLTESLWISIEDIYEKILRHPFIRGLTDGSLDEEVFRFYVIQDALYLKDYARGLVLLGDGFLEAKRGYLNNLGTIDPRNRRIGKEGLKNTLIAFTSQ
jgi:thiaminase